MSITTIIQIVAGAFMGILLLYWFIEKRKDKKAEFEVARNKKRERAKNRRNRLYAITQFIKRFPLTKKRYNKMRGLKRSVYPADSISVDIETTKSLLFDYTIAILIIAVMVIGSKLDVFFSAMGVIVAYLILDWRTDNSASSMRLKLLEQLRVFITMLIANYNKCNMVDDAVRMTLPVNPKEIGAHAELIYKALTSVRIKEASDEYVEKAPNEYLMLLMAICSSVQEYGDKRIGNNESMFIKNLTYLNEEVSKAITLIHENNNSFKNQIFFCILPAFVIKPLEFWVESIMPSSKSYFEGMQGTMIMAMEFVIVLLSYYVVKSLKSGKEIAIKETSTFKTISQLPFISKVLRAYNKKHYSKAQRINDQLLLTRDRTGVNAFYVKKSVLAIAVVFIVAVLFGASTLRERATILSDFSESYQSAFVTSESYRKIMQETSQEIADYYRQGIIKETTPDAVVEYVKDNTTIQNDVYAQLIADEVVAKINTYKDTYYKWYFLIIAYIAGAIAFIVPNFLLKFQVKQAEKEETDEIAQYQTLALILMHVDGMTLEQVLEWMDRFAFCFKYRIERCILDLPHGEAKALDRLQDGPSAQFNQFVDNLQNIDNVGILQAFSSIEGDREYYKELRQQQNAEAIKSRSTIGSLVQFAPVVIIILFQMIMPLFMMSTQMNSQMNSALSGTL